MKGISSSRKSINIFFKRGESAYLEMPFKGTIEENSLKRIKYKNIKHLFEND